MYPDSHKVSLISHTLQYCTGMPLWLEKAPNMQQYEYGQLVLGDTESSSYRSNKYAWDLCIRNDTVDQFFRWSACLTTEGYNGYFTDVYSWYSSNVYLHSQWDEPISPGGYQKFQEGMVSPDWNCGVPTLETWHILSRVEMRFCWRIPKTMFSSCSFLYQRLSRTSDCCTSLIWLIPNVWNSSRGVNRVLNFSTTPLVKRFAWLLGASGGN